MKLSILVPYIRRHEAFFYKLQFKLYAQMLPYVTEVELLSDNHEYDSIGAKRNRLLERATGEFVAFFDSDDRPSDDYIKLLMEGIESNPDCCSLRGEYSIDGIFDGIFEHSIKYKEWATTKNEVKYERFTNHLNAVKSSIAKQFKYPDKSHGEDFDWSTLVHESGLIKTEYYIPSVIYFYDFINDKNKQHV